MTYQKLEGRRLMGDNETKHLTGHKSLYCVKWLIQ